jgi:hypothetical protein
VSPVRFIRLLVALTWVFPLVCGLLAQLTYTKGIEAEKQFHAWARTYHPDAAAYCVVAMMFAVFILSVVVSAGMWLFRRWARLLYIPSGLLFAIYGPWSWYFPTRASEAVQFISYALQGVVFACACCPPFSQLFLHPRSNQPMQPTAGRSEANP